MSALAASGAPVGRSKSWPAIRHLPLHLALVAHARPADVATALDAQPELQDGQSVRSNRCSKHPAEPCDSVRVVAEKLPLLSAAVNVAVSTEVDAACDFMRGKTASSEKEVLVGVEPTMAHLQSAALATWLQRRKRLLLMSLRS